jgi:D-alanyl-D-alanine carboxypeptidase
MSDNIFTPEQQQQMAEMFAAFAQVVQETDPLIKAKMEEAKRAKEAADALNRFKENLGSSAMNFGKSLMSSQAGMGKFGDSISGAASATGDFVSRMGPAGAALGVFVKVIGAVTSAALKQNDALMKSYQNLSNLGSVTEGGLEGLHKQLARVGLIAEEAEKFERVLAPITSQLALFNGGVTQGRKAFVDITAGLIGPGNSLEQSLMRLGYTTDDIREGTADYLQRQIRLGIAQTKSSEALRSESFKYLTTMKELQELTGMTRDEQQKARDMQLADARMSLHIRTLGREEAENLQNYLMLYEKQFGKEAASGLKDLIVNNGKITTDLAAASYQFAYNGYQNAMKVQKEGTNAMAGAIKSTSEAAYIRIKQFGGNIMLVEEALRDMGLSSEAINGVLSGLKINTKGVTETLARLGKTQAEGTGKLEDSIDIEQKSRSLRIAADQALAATSGLVVTAFKKLMDMLYATGKFLAKMIDSITNSSFGKYFGMSGTNLSASFRDINDNLADLQKVQERTFKIHEEISKENQKVFQLDKVKNKDEIKNAQLRIKNLQAELKLEQDKKEKLMKENDEVKGSHQSAREGRYGNPVTSKYVSSSTPSPAPAAASSPAAPDAASVIKFTGNSGSEANFNKLQPQFRQQALNAAIGYYNETGKKMQVNSAFRDSKDQQRLWDESVRAGRPGVGPTGKTIAQPGTSRHERGLAIDVQQYTDPFLIRNMNKNGLHNPFKTSDPVHFQQARWGGIFKGPNSGYPVTLHGNEAVVRVDQLKAMLNAQEDPAVTKTPLSTGLQMTPSQTRAESDLVPLLSTAIERLDVVIEQTRRSAQIQDELLTITRVK